MVTDYISRMFVLFFASFWFISLMISTFNPLGLFEVSDRVYFILFCNVISFVMGFCILKASHVYSRETSVAIFSYSLERFLNNKIIIALGISAILFVLVTAQKQMALLAIDANDMADFSTGRNDALFSSPLLSIVYNLLIPVAFQISLFLFAYFLLFNKKIVYLVVLGIFVISRALIGGSRGSLFVIVVYIVCLYFMRNLLTKQTRQKKRRSKLFYVFTIPTLVVGIYFILVFLTSMRHGDIEMNSQTYEEHSTGLQHTFINYSCGPFRAMDYGLKNHFDDYAGGMLMGRSTFSGLEDLVNLFTKRIGIDLDPVSQRTVQHQQDIRISVSKSFHQFNYAYTNAMIFYYDGKLLGVIFFSFIFGCVVKCAIREMYREMTLPIVLLVAYLFYGIYHSTFTWFLVKNYAWLYIIILLIWHRFEKKKCAIYRMKLFRGELKKEN